MTDHDITREKIIIRTRSLKNGNRSIYLEMNHEGKRTTECLHLYLIPEKNEEDRKQNELTMLAAQHIRAERYRKAVKEGFSHDLLDRGESDIKLVDYILGDIEQRNKKGMANCYNHYNLINWIIKIAPNIRLSEVNRIFAIKLRDYLACTPSKYTGKLLKSSYVSKMFTLFGTLMQKATEEGKANFRQELLPSLKGLGQPSRDREFLTLEELQRLIKTPFMHEQLRTAFLFSCATGLRLADLKRLKWENIVIHDDKTQVETLQSKTRKYVYVPLNKLALSVLPKRKGMKELVFEINLSRTVFNKHLQKWISNAGIDKQISYNCARHTFATLQYDLGASLATTQKNLGHHKIETTMVYTHILEGKKLEVTDRINKMFEERMKKKIVWKTKQKR